MENIREHIYLAALLHDIGKFYQRADSSFADRFNDLSDYSKRIANDICPINDFGKFGYQHVVWTNEFLEKKKVKLQSVPGIQQNLHGKENSEDSLASFACNHHKPMTELQALITMADWWSAGIDRTQLSTFEKDDDNSGQIIWGKQRYKHIPLYSIFNQINKDNYNYAFGLNPLTLEENDFFPKKIEQKEDGVNQEQYKQLWELFLEEFDKLPDDSFDSFSESLLFLLKKYTWCIPSNTMDMANVSLFDHLKTTAAFADCLYLYKNERPEAFKWDSVSKRLSLTNDHLPVILLGGDLSGIQSFIYNIASRKAAVSLKGRSFYLQLLLDSAIQCIITHSDINCLIGQVVYSSGGKFYMLLPNTDKVRKAIDDLQTEFEAELWSTHHGQLALNLSYVPFAFDSQSNTILYDEDKKGKIGDLWKCLADKLTDGKNKKFNTVLLNSYDDLFEPQSIDPDHKVCAVTGIEGKCVPIESQVGDEDEKTYVLETVREQVKLGTTLKGVDYLLTYKEKDKNTYLSNRSKCNIGIFKTYNYLFNKIELTDNDADFRFITSADVSRVKMINKLNFLDAQIKGQKVSYGFQFYGGNKQAQIQDKNTNDKRDKTFEELSDNTYLGILRMDVDGLGAIFINGLPVENRSFAAYSTLSFMLDYFFSGYLNTIREKEQFRDDVNILYSGGDDLFAVGKWDKLILFAETIRKEFARFVGRNDISISGGIVLVRNKYPISKAATLASDAEDLAKRFSKNGVEVKNALNLFGENVSWENEFDFVKEYKSRFVNLIQNEKMSHSILHRLMLLCQKMKDERVSYLWQTAYFLKRFADNKNDKIKEFCKQLQTDVLEKRKYELIAIAARWAELELRFSNNK